MTHAAIGQLLRAWRAKRNMSQLALALDAGVSARHLSFVESGRSTPSPQLLLRLSESLQVPLRARNELFQAAGFASRYPETTLTAPDLAEARRTIEQLLTAHDPYPGVAVDRHWNVVLCNQGAKRLIETLPAPLRIPTTNLFRAGLHPRGFAASTTNFSEWGAYLLGAVERMAMSTIDPTVDALLAELRGYPNVQALGPGRTRARTTGERMGVCFELVVDGEPLNLLSTLLTFGSPRDVTLAELTLEIFYPADPRTAAALRAARR